MDFLELFTLKDVFLVSVGLMIAIIFRIYYDMYNEKTKVKYFAQSLELYNSLMDEKQEGLFILTKHYELVSINKEALIILKVEEKNINQNFLEKIIINTQNKSQTITLFDAINNNLYLANVYIQTSQGKIPLSINIQTIEENEIIKSYIIILRDLTCINNLKDNARDLLEIV